MRYFSGCFDVRYVSCFSVACIDIAPSFCKDGGYVNNSPTYPPSFRHAFHKDDGVIEPWHVGAGTRADLVSISLFIISATSAIHPQISYQMLCEGRH